MLHSGGRSSGTLAEQLCTTVYFAVVRGRSCFGHPPVIRLHRSSRIAAKTASGCNVVPAISIHGHPNGSQNEPASRKGHTATIWESSLGRANAYMALGLL